MRKNEDPVGISILNWNGYEDTLKCLLSFQDINYSNYEVLVVDNGSKKNEAKLLEKQHFNKVSIVRKKSNLGFCGGNNFAYEYFKKKKVKYLLTLNNDTEIDKNFLREMIKTANNNNKIGMVSPLIFFMSPKNLLNTTGIKIYQDGSAFNENKNLSVKELNLKKPIRNFGASGGAALYRIKMLEEIGFFDKEFFAYLEDADLAFRANLSGWKSFICPKAKIYHKHSASSGKIPYFKLYQIERNRIWLLLKNFPWTMVVISPYYTFKRYLYTLSLHNKNDVGNTFSKDEKPSPLLITLTIFKSYIDALKKIKYILYERRRIQKNVKLGKGRFHKYFHDFGFKLIF